MRHFHQYKNCFIIFLLALSLIQCNRKTAKVIEKPSKQQKAVISKTKPSEVKKIENFDNFYQRFHTDSIFQISRVQFPLKGQQIRMDGSSAWKKDKWLMIKAKASEIDKNQFNIKTLKKEDSYFEGIYCKNCVFTFEMEYKLINGKWYLVYLNEKDE